MSIEKHRGGRSIDTARVILFVPGDRPERIARALSAGADAVVIDLEDSVAPANKPAAREAAARAVETTRVLPVGVRVNALTTPDGIRDLAALLEGPAGFPDFVVLPKVESAAEARLCTQVLGGRNWPGELVCAIESGAGLEHAAEIAAADPHVVALGFGGADLAAALGAEPAWEPMLPARARLIWAAGAAGISALDMPCFDLDSAAVLAEECRRARALGFTGKFAIHPKQVDGVRQAFTPTARQVADAHAVLRAAEDGGAVRFRGSMIDAAQVRRARLVIERAGGGA
ncbi:HpcH/HpaI aldolase/citrate lyase family protein [Sphaerisporangium fuscum]|uniref:HpcH/HpaI aldolase/citrate lyase family protein n=1 Tax=Sphaerisporangium fuscum TaxID=2835868 RepID=UPI001BDD31BF|nr:CoA ester lyase [Sphaerisporangium fuscum]